MKKIGSSLFLIALLAIVLNFVDMVPRLLIWIYAWGDATAWAIKIGVLVLGAALWVFSEEDEE